MESVLQWAQEHTLALCLAVGAVINCFWLWRYRGRLPMPIWVIPVVSLIHTLVGVFCVRVFAGMENWGNPLQSGQSLFGGIILLPIICIFTAKLFKRKIADVLDVAAVLTVTTLFFARINCIMSGCCLGSSIPGSQVYRWPTREAELVFHGVLLFFLDKRVMGKGPRGEVWPFYMMTYGFFRFFEEWFRSNARVFGPLHFGHIWAVVSIIIGSAIYFEISSREGRSTGRRRS